MNFFHKSEKICEYFRIAKVAKVAKVAKTMNLAVLAFSPICLYSQYYLHPIGHTKIITVLALYPSVTSARQNVRLIWDPNPREEHSRKKWFCVRDPDFWKYFSEFSKLFFRIFKIIFPNFQKYFSEFSGVFFRIFPSIFPNFPKYFSEFSVFFRIFSPKLSEDLFFLGLTSIFPNFRKYFSELFSIFPNFCYFPEIPLFSDYDDRVEVCSKFTFWWLFLFLAVTMALMENSFCMFLGLFLLWISICSHRWEYVDEGKAVEKHWLENQYFVSIFGLKITGQRTNILFQYFGWESLVREPIFCFNILVENHRSENQYFVSIFWLKITGHQRINILQNTLPFFPILEGLTSWEVNPWLLLPRMQKTCGLPHTSTSQIIVPPPQFGGNLIFF